MKKTKGLFITLATLIILYATVVYIVPQKLDEQHNQTRLSAPYSASKSALALYNSLDFVADLHCDALLWSRDLTVKNTIGHVDFRRMQEANMALQAFTIVTKSPMGQNFSKNSEDSFDNITLLNIVQGRPLSNWFSLYERAVYQSRRLHKFADDFKGEFIVVTSLDDLNELIARRKQDRKVVGGFLGIEGGHCLEGKIENLDKLYEEGVRMLGPTHFFDNKLGGSAHGISEGGLSRFGHQVIERMNALGIIIDLAHASPALIDDVLAQTQKPVLVSHTGVKGTLDNSRNLSDAHVRKIAGNGGLIGVAYFKGAVTAPLIKGIVAAMQHIKTIAGTDCIALGSDFDGSATTPFDVTGLPLLVEELIDKGFTDKEITEIMGGNIKRFLQTNLD